MNNFFYNALRVNIDFYYITNNILKRELAAQTKNIVYQTFSSAVGCNDPISTPVVDPDLDPQDADIQYESKEALLDKIITSDAIISFEYSNRLDFVDLKRLDKIIIKDKSGHLIAEKRFNYEYFQSLIDLPAPSDPTEDKTKRLKLLSYQECDRDGKCTTTSFEYYEQNKMTQRLSYATDHWGYFNNKTNNKGFPNVPIKYQDTSTNTPVKAFASDLGTGIIQIADKNVNPDYVQTFSLKSITYPEGGKNEFIYEPNTASSLLYRPDEEHYFLAKNNIIKRDFFFSVTGSVTGEDINYGIPPNSSINNTKIFIKEIDLTNYNKQLNLKITRSSTFKASTFSNYLDSSYLYAEMSVFYYENGVKKYWIVDSPMNVQTVINFNQYNNSNIPLQKVYVEIKHTYWGGLGSGNISNYMYFYSQVSFNWEENNPNLSDDPIIYAGGIRIKEIKQYDNGQYKYSTKYIYKKAENPQFSSGVLFNIPMYTKNKRIGKVDEISCYSGGHRTYKIAKNAIELSTRPVIAGMRTQGRTIGYTNVEVIKTDINNP
ncbi:hypothetical protein BA768_20760 [Chryseobacterium sp. CBo1]|uniref:hypothetical protein n=1 Tax=Chryseobacterium sp. CBo1 TaxID=1869230 RepID=UPI000810AC51|nr:hypothetical protein [Chryseobacterium sp. CBo1]OCK50050.1 hypothetical protein BA768_20760 [Chryseobacterium sp. CBo1]